MSKISKQVRACINQFITSVLYTCLFRTTKYFYKKVHFNVQYF